MTLADFLSAVLRQPMPLLWQSGSPSYRVGGIYIVRVKRYHYPLATPVTTVVHVGQTEDIAKRLDDHVREYVDPLQGLPVKALTLVGSPIIQATWAAVARDLRNGVENYVGNRLCPGGVYPNVTPVPVTLPDLT